MTFCHPPLHPGSHNDPVKGTMGEWEDTINPHKHATSHPALLADLRAGVQVTPLSSLGCRDLNSLCSVSCLRRGRSLTNPYNLTAVQYELQLKQDGGQDGGRVYRVPGRTAEAPPAPGARSLPDIWTAPAFMTVPHCSLSQPPRTLRPSSSCPLPELSCAVPPHCSES